MWLTKLKTALILEDFETLSSLLDEMPQFDTLQQIEEASYLLAQSKISLEKNRAETAHILQQLKNSLNFLKSTQTEPPSSLNLKF
ncbi:MAG: hypothetical protein Q8M43_08095 [Sulfuricurvum sp.]|uniref:hypothetical protein n=1 Tax=Sulfuricurvum sp. TaxID=2025608 RepID=UPI002732CB6C|nr:hypothetical protein [Sulfuricurvum sp.]MDP2851600.1 hypothetical protein [Sulfuricurvum sp.]MDP3291976.1 hypothetical protein [Sulfuricurvum sp.]